MSNLIDIQSQIQKLQKQASEIKAREFDSTVRDILTKMEAFGITVKDLQAAAAGPTKGRGRKGAKNAVKVTVNPTKIKKASNPVAPKYRGPNGEAWSGRGLTPRWLTVLLEEGKTKEDFAIQA